MFESVMVPWGAGTVWILGVAVKSSLVLLLGLLTAAALHRASASLRHLVWSGGILAVLLLPPVSLVLPWQLAVFSVPIPVAESREAGVQLPAPAGDASEREIVGATSGFVAENSSGGLFARTGETALPWLIVIWVAGVLFFLTRLGIGALVMRRVLHGATPLDSPDWTHPLIEGADRLAVARLPRLLANDSVPMPVVCGVLNPAIVVPADAGEWTDRRRRAVLCHELAHIRRYDLPANLLGRLACALHWFNPLVWVAARRLRVESERACDDFVLGVGTRPSEYADHLLQIVGRARHSQAPAVAIPMAQRREFEGRMLAILDEDARRDPPSRIHSAGFAALAFLLLLPIAAMAPAPALRSTADEHSHPSATQPDSAGSSGLLGALLEGLSAPAAHDRAAAAYAIGTLREYAALSPLGDHLRQDPDSNVRLTAAWALGEIASPDATRSLSGAALKDVAVSVREMAVSSLGQIADPSALSTLEAALGDSLTIVRARAAWAIGLTRPTKASTSLLAALHDNDNEVREIAAWAIGQTGDQAAVRALTFAVGDPFPKVGIAALWSLAQIGGPETYQPLRDAIGGEYVDAKLRAAIEQALLGESVEPQPRSPSRPKIRLPMRP